MQRLLAYIAKKIHLYKSICLATAANENICVIPDWIHSVTMLIMKWLKEYLSKQLHEGVLLGQRGCFS